VNAQLEELGLHHIFQTLVEKLKEDTTKKKEIKRRSFCIKIQFFYIFKMLTAQILK
jgi:hypothetical protein